MLGTEFGMVFSFKVGERPGGEQDQGHLVVLQVQEKG